MMKRTAIHLVRHGKVQNPEKVRYDLDPSLDFPLSKTGRYQARILGRFFEARGISAVYSSPLLRTVQTAEAIAAQSGITVVKDKRLEEASLNGDEEEPAGYKSEGLRAVGARMQAAVSQYVRNHPGEEVVAISHAWPISLAVWMHEEEGFRERSVFRCPVSSITTLTFEEDSYLYARQTDLRTVRLNELQPGKVLFIFR